MGRRKVSKYTMRGIQLVFKDWKNLLLHKHGRIALVFLLLVPLIYAGLFLSGYWDPYGRLDQLPVAVVNLDQGSVLDGKSIHAGDDFVRDLQTNKELDFQFVSAANAEDGLREGRYYMTITVPGTFSQKVATLMSEHPQQAQLVYRTNAGKNFVASQIGSTAVKEIKAKIDAGITKSYASGVFANMQAMFKGFGDAGSGALTLNEGTAAAKEGMARLSSGIHRAAGGASQLQQGSTRLLEGEQSLREGIDGLAGGAVSLASNLDKLSAGHQSIEAGSSKIAEGMQAWAAGSKQVELGQQQAAQAADSLRKGLADYWSAHSEAADDQQLRSLAAESERLASAVNNLTAAQARLAASAETLSGGQQQAAQGIRTFGGKMHLAAGGAQQLSDGVDKLSHGFSDWDSGYRKLAAGIDDLASGGQQLDNGAAELESGLVTLQDGTGQLSTKLGDAAAQSSRIHNTDALTTMFAQPVELVESKLTDVPNYGSGIAPYFLCLAFFVGGIMGANILPLGRRKDLKVAGSAHFVNKLGLFYSIGLIQTAIVDAVVLFIFKLHVTSIPMFLLFTLLVSFAFLTIIHMLVTVFGIVGKFASVTLLILQLSTCGGTFPMELNAPIMNAIGRCLPMTYALQGLTSVISLGDTAQIRNHALILLGYLAGAALIGLLATLFHETRHKETVAAAH
jgi:putative membrane protein